MILSTRLQNNDGASFDVTTSTSSYLHRKLPTTSLSTLLRSDLPCFATLLRSDLPRPKLPAIGRNKVAVHSEIEERTIVRNKVADHFEIKEGVAELRVTLEWNRRLRKVEIVTSQTLVFLSRNNKL